MTITTSFKFSALAAALLLPAAASAAPALVADVETGRVIYAEQATDPWFPASVIKLMTAYVTLEAMRDGKVTLDTPLSVSERAAAMPPSKMGFKPGLELTVDNALKIIMVKSANDVATTLAEGVGGSVEGFAERMNVAAKKLGMRDSYFVNPHGLPDERNRTSARDLALLGRALLREFPTYQGYFGIGAIRFGKRVMNNHNGLIGRYPGANGMKTGFICSSGFNVVATARRGGRELIVVVLGSRSAKDRTIKAAQLFDRGFADLGWGGSGTLETLSASLRTSPADMRDYICGGRKGPVGEEEQEAPTPVEASAATSNNPILDLFKGPAAAAPQVARYTLGPRQAFEPIPVWVGRTPPTPSAVADAEEASKPKARSKTTKAPAGKPARATAFAPDQPSATAAEAPAALEKATKSAGKPVLRPGAAKPGAIAARPKAESKEAADKPDAKAAAKPRTKAAGKKADAKQ